MRQILQDPNLSKKELRNLALFVSIFGVLLALFVLYFVIFYRIYDALVVMGLAFFGTIPAFLSNAFMTLTGKIPGIKRYPIDGGKEFRGNRIFGEGKSWNGLIGGIVLGFALSYLLSLLYPWLYAITIKNMSNGTSLLEYIKTSDILFFVDTQANPLAFQLRMILLCVGGPIGDLVGSFIKRRFNKKRGSQFFVVDQIDFIVVSILLAYPVFPIKFVYILFLILFTPLITVLANVFAYYIGKKDVPW